MITYQYKDGRKESLLCYNIYAFILIIHTLSRRYALVFAVFGTWQVFFRSVQVAFRTRQVLFRNVQVAFRTQQMLFRSVQVAFWAFQVYILSIYQLSSFSIFWYLKMLEITFCKRKKAVSLFTT